MYACWRRVLEPRPVYIVVDRSEELVMYCPEEAVGWADALIGLHAGSNLARVIFVVDFDAGAQALFNLLAKRRFHKVMFTPAAVEQLPVVRRKMGLLDSDLYAKCQNNIAHKRRGLVATLVCTMLMLAVSNTVTCRRKGRPTLRKRH